MTFILFSILLYKEEKRFKESITKGKLTYKGQSDNIVR
ncbi:MAG: hypothetical protein ACFWTM_06055 [Mitsuokella multacida]|jgi:hypothetical protein